MESSVQELIVYQEPGNAKTTSQGACQLPITSLFQPTLPCRESSNKDPQIPCSVMVLSTPKSSPKSGYVYFRFLILEPPVCKDPLHLKRLKFYRSLQRS